MESNKPTFITILYNTCLHLVMGLCSDKTDLNLTNTENLSVISTIKDTTHAVAE